MVSTHASTRDQPVRLHARAPESTGTALECDCADRSAGAVFILVFVWRGGCQHRPTVALSHWAAWARWAVDWHVGTTHGGTGPALSDANGALRVRCECAAHVIRTIHITSRCEFRYAHNIRGVGGSEMYVADSEGRLITFKIHASDHALKVSPFSPFVSPYGSRVYS